MCVDGVVNPVNNDKQESKKQKTVLCKNNDNGVRF